MRFIPPARSAKIPIDRTGLTPQNPAENQPMALMIRIMARNSTRVRRRPIITEKPLSTVQIGWVWPVSLAFTGFTGNPIGEVQRRFPLECVEDPAGPPLH